MSLKQDDLAASVSVDPENPWLGLSSYTEETRAYFHGRDEEAAELARRGQRKLLTVLFGQSGLGKTSLLRAGLVPRLRGSGFCPVLGYIIQQVSGMSYEEFLKESIFVPLGLDDTGYAFSSDGLAIGYDSQYTSLPADLDEAAIFDASGALYSSAEDLYRWDQALYTEALLPRASLERMFTPYVEVSFTGYEEEGYGYSWIINQKDDRTAIMHGGGLPGVSTIIARYPEEQITIIVLCNNANSDAANIWELIAGKIFGTE